MPVPRSGRPEPRCLRWGGLSSNWETASAVVVALEGGLPQAAVKKQGAVELDVSAPLFDSATSNYTGHGTSQNPMLDAYCGRGSPLAIHRAHWGFDRAGRAGIIRKACLGTARRSTH